MAENENLIDQVVSTDHTGCSVYPDLLDLYNNCQVVLQKDERILTYAR